MANSSHVTSTVVGKSIPFDNGTNGFTSTNVQAAIEEARMGAGGGTAIPEYLVDPASPVAGDAWVLHSSAVGSPIGLLLSLTNATNTYKLSYKTISGGIVRVNLT